MKSDNKSAPAPRCILYVQIQPLGICQFCCNGQTQPKMFFVAAGSVAPIKTVKYLQFIIVGDTHALVSY